MRNSSDIFNLKELKDGDTNGMEMFSVNGVCQLTKLSRRRNLHAESSTFEYGSSSAYKAPVDLAEVHKGTGDYTDLLGENLDNINEELGELELDGPESSRSDDADFNNGDMYSEKTTSPKKKTPVSSVGNSPTKKKSPVFRKLNSNKKGEMMVAESAMARNPLTGVGVEIESHRKSKKGPARPVKWSW